MNKELYTPFLVWIAANYSDKIKNRIQDAVIKEDITALWGYLIKYFESKGLYLHTVSSGRLDGKLDFQIDNLIGYAVDSGTNEYNSINEAQIACANEAFLILQTI